MIGEEIGWFCAQSPTVSFRGNPTLRDLLGVMLEESDPRLPPWYLQLDKVSVQYSHLALQSRPTFFLRYPGPASSTLLHVHV